VPRQPANRVHVDQTATSGVARLRTEYPDEADELLRRRVAIVNLWRPIKSPALDAPLAVCDARSVAPHDLIASDLVFRDRRGETYNLLYNPSQRWFYAPAMGTDEVLLLIKCFDSRDDGAVARLAPHTAFVDPTAPQDAPRESIELRTFVAPGGMRRPGTPVAGFRLVPLHNASYKQICGLGCAQSRRSLALLCVQVGTQCPPCSTP
jgi:hypothetical protein